MVDLERTNGAYESEPGAELPFTGLFGAAKEALAELEAVAGPTLISQKLRAALTRAEEPVVTLYPRLLKDGRWFQRIHVKKKDGEAYLELVEFGSLVGTPVPDQPQNSD